jgi:hypothetical protein
MEEDAAPEVMGAGLIGARRVKKLILAICLAPRVHSLSASLYGQKFTPSKRFIAPP